MRIRSLFVALVWITLLSGPRDSFGLKLLAPDGAAGDKFGLAVAVHRDYALVGAPNHSGGGSAYVFNAHTGGHLFTLNPKDTGPKEAFGSSIAAYGNTIIVGDPEAGSDDSGLAYLFDLNTGQELRTLSPSDPGSEYDFGGHVDMDGNLAVVGSVWADYEGVRSGAAYVFDVPTGDQLSKIGPSDGATDDVFGKVSISGDLLAIGAGQGVKSAPGGAYLYDVGDPENPSELSKIVLDDGADGDRFGAEVSLDGDRLLLGAPKRDDDGADSGSAYLYDVSDPRNPELLSTLAPSDPEAGDHFGVGVALDGNRAVVGARHGNRADGVETGATYLFDVSKPDNPSQLRKTTPSDGAAGDLFGYQVDIDGSLIIAGARHDDELGENAGAAYLSAVPAPSSLIALIGMGVMGVVIGIRRWSRSRNS